MMNPNPDIIKAAQVLFVYEQLKQMTNNQMNGFGMFNPIPSFPVVNPIPPLPLASDFKYNQKFKKSELKNNFSIASLTSSPPSSISSTSPSTPLSTNSSTPPSTNSSTPPSTSPSMYTSTSPLMYSSKFSSTTSSKLSSTPPSTLPSTLPSTSSSILPATPNSPWDNTAFESQLNKSNPSVSSSNIHRPVRCVVNEQTAKPLEDWMKAHLNYPYPTREDVDKLMKETGFDNTQVRGWFTNHRRRIAAEYEKKGQKLPWEKKQGPLRALRHSPY